ncbi:methyltransferase [Streptomyces sp. NPDC097610]|uniref:methyltransferase n=1 Tax=Streptomyces sp. NPDC097610 TaxID=3157227 RepID=UPI003330234F
MHWTARQHTGPGKYEVYERLNREENHMSINPGESWAVNDEDRSTVTDGTEALRMVDMILGFTLSQAIYVAAKLDIATALAEKQRSVEELAEYAQAQPDFLRRIMRTLASHGVFTQYDADNFGLTPLGSTLIASEEGSVRDAAIMFMETQYKPFSKLVETVQTGKSAAQLYYGRPYFAQIALQPEQLLGFTKTMAATSSQMVLPLLDHYQLPEGRVVADIGGADGTLLAHFLTQNKDRQGVMFDLPHVVGSSSKVFAAANLTSRVEIVAGDFFQSVPTGVDIYIVKQILHDWTDDECRQILHNIAKAAAPGARVLIIEMVVPDGDIPHPSKTIDLVMMGMLTGKERSREEFRSLLSEAGMMLDQVVETPGYSVLETTVLAAV